MKKFPVFGIIMLAVFFSWVKVNSTTYYVSKTGDDGNSGLDTANAWGTIKYAAQTLTAGDTVLVVGGRYNEDYIHPQNSGTYSNRIVYKAYPGHEVWIDGMHTIHSVFEIGKLASLDSGKSYITVDSLNVTNSGKMSDPGNICGGAILIGWGCNQIKFKNCSICTTYGYSNTSSFFIQFSDSITIENCKMFHNRENGLDGIGGNVCGITIYGSSSHDPIPTMTRDIKIENCEIYDVNTGIKYKEPGEPGHFYVLNNEIHDIERGILARYDSSIIRNNIIYDPKTSGATGIWIGYDLGPVAGGDYCKVENNTVINMTQASINNCTDQSLSPGGPEGLEVRNNIFYYYGSYGGIATWMNEGGDPDSFYYDYNCYFDEGSNIQCWGYGICYTLTTARSSLGSEIYGMKADPKFVDPENHDYRLQADSPCRGAADDGGDMGALQYEGEEDGTPPYTTGHNPAKNATGVSVNTDISLHIRDSGDGVEISSIRLTVDSQQIPYDSLRITGDSLDYAVVYEPLTDFGYDSVIPISIDAQDLHNPPNIMPQESYSFTTESVPDTIPPVISQVKATDITNTEATITWETDELSDSQVEYGLSASYGLLSPLNSILTIHHQVTLTDLTNSTTYHYRVLSSDNSRNKAMSEDSTFATDSSATVTEEWGDGEGSNHPNTCFDTYVNAGSPSTNYSSDALSINTYTWPANTIANDMIIKWDLSAIPDSAQIEKAQLYLYLIDTGGDEIYDLPIHKIINVNPIIGQCTWNTCNGTNPWTGGQDGGQQDIAPAEDTLQCDTEIGYKVWNVTEMVRDWVANPSTNFGMMVNSDNTASRDSWRYFTPTESGHSDQRPRLIITYSVESSGPGRPGRPHWR